MTKAQLQSCSDSQLVSLLRAGNRRAAEVLYKRHIESLRCYFHVKLGSKTDHSEIEDLCHETLFAFTTAIVKGKVFQSPRAYLFGIAYNKVADSLKRRYKWSGQVDPAHSCVEDIDAYPSMEQGWNIDSRELMTALHRLPIKDQILILLHKVQGFTCAEIIEALGLECREATLRGRVFRILLKLK